MTGPGIAPAGRAKGRAAPSAASLPTDEATQMADRETIITDGGGDGSGGIGAGMVAALILVLVLLLAGGYVVINHGSSSSTVSVDIPKVTVTLSHKHIRRCR